MSLHYTCEHAATSNNAGELAEPLGGSIRALVSFSTRNHPAKPPHHRTRAKIAKTPWTYSIWMFSPAH